MAPSWAWCFLMMRFCRDPHADSAVGVCVVSQHHLHQGRTLFLSWVISRWIPWCCQMSLLCAHYVFSLANHEQSVKRHLKTMQVSCMSSHPSCFSVCQPVAMVTNGWFPAPSLSPSLCLPFIHPSTYLSQASVSLINIDTQISDSLNNSYLILHLSITLLLKLFQSQPVGAPSCCRRYPWGMLHSFPYFLHKKYSTLIS